MASKDIIIACNAFNSKAKISNANWESTINEAITINPGDTISIKNSYIDARLHNSQNILLTQDTTIEIEIMFYYINRGGCPERSVKVQNYQNTGPYPYSYALTTLPIYNPIAGTTSGGNAPKCQYPQWPQGNTYENTSPYQQVNASEMGALTFADAFEEVVNHDGTPAYPVSHLNWKGIVGFNNSWVAASTDPVAKPINRLPMDDTQVQTIQNMTPVVESIYTCPFRLLNLPPSASGYTQQDAVPFFLGALQPNYDPATQWITPELRYTNPAAFIDTIDVMCADGLPYLLYQCGPLGCAILPDPTGPYGGQPPPAYPSEANGWVLDRFSSSFMQCDGSAKFLDGDVQGLVPHVKKFKYTIKKGSYTPDKLATLITDQMSAVNPKVVRGFTGAQTLGTNVWNPYTYDMLSEPSQLMTSQLFPDTHTYGSLCAPSTITNEFDSFGPASNVTEGFSFAGTLTDTLSVPESVLIANTQQTIVPKHGLTPYYMSANATTNYPALSGLGPINGTTGAPTPAALANVQCGINPYGRFSSYMPSFQFMSKNFKSYPLNNTTPTDPIDIYNPIFKHALIYDLAEDYNRQEIPLDKDSTPFICRPIAAQVPFVVNPTLTGNPTETTWGVNGNNFYISPDGTTAKLNNDNVVAGYKLFLNDDNLENYGLQSYLPSDATMSPLVQTKVEMMYMPFLTDVKSNYFISKQIINIPEEIPTMKYGIRPILSTQRIPQNPYTDNAAKGTGFVGTGGSAINPAFCGVSDISSPIVGASEISLQYNQANDNLFSFNFMHTPIYAKPDTSTTDILPVVAEYPTTIYKGVGGGSGVPSFTTTLGVVQCASQSGVLFKSMTATNADGTPSSFWQRLGFDVDAITTSFNPARPSDPFLTYSDFLKKTTRGFKGTSDIYQPNLHACGLNEWSPLSYRDATTMTGWWTMSSRPWAKTKLNTNFYPDGPLSLEFSSNFAFGENPYQQFVNLNTDPLYSAVQTTNQITATSIPVDTEDTGHYLIEITGYSTSFMNNTEKSEVKSIVSSYYVSPNSFISNANPENFVYYHSGQPIKMTNLKIRILNPLNLEESPLLGPNTSVYLQIVKQYSKLFQAEDAVME